MFFTVRSIGFALAFALSGAASADVLKVPQQFATISDAVSAAGPGDEIVVAKGAYEGNFSISAKTDLTLRASGKVVLKPPTMFAPSFVLALFGCTNVTVQGFRIVAPDSLDGIRFDACSNCTIVRCRVKGGMTNVNVTASAGAYLDRCTLTDAVSFGVSAFGTSAILSQCTVLRSGSTGIFASNVLCEVRRCTVKGSASGGIQLLGLGTAIVVDNDVRDTALGTAIATDSQSNAIVAGNHVRGASAGVIAPGSGTTILENRFEAVTVVAIDVNADHVVTRGNRITKCEVGLLLHALADEGTHEDNSLLRCATDGIVVKGGATDVLLERNVTRKSGGFGLRDESGGSTTSIANRFDSIAP